MPRHVSTSLGKVIEITKPQNIWTGQYKRTFGNEKYNYYNVVKMSYTTFSRQQLWNQFHQFPKQTSIEAFEKVCFTLQVQPTNQLKKLVQNESAHYKKKINPKKPTKDTPVVPNNYILCKAVQLEPATPATPDEQMDIDEPIDIDDHPSSPNLRRPFHLIMPRSKRIRTEDVKNLLKQLVELENLQTPI